MKDGEFKLIGHIREMFGTPADMLGIGDDCAVIPQDGNLETLVSTDMLVEGIHFLPDASPYELGWKSAAVNISDIAGMGGTPVGSFLSMALPRTLKDSYILDFLHGYKDLSDRYGCPLLGGDTTSSPDRLCISVTVIGSCPRGKSVKRSGALPGDLICCTGTLGDSAAGLKILLGEVRSGSGSLIRRHCSPLPRIEEGLALAQAGVHAMMDISDGIGSDIRHILEESGCGAVIDTRALPVSDELREFCDANGLDTRDLALEGGEDYELLFTLAPETEAQLKVGHSVIGRITGGSGVEWLGGSKDYMGFRHF